MDIRSFLKRPADDTSSSETPAKQPCPPNSEQPLTIIDVPFQPTGDNFVYPKENGRCFLPHWYKDYPWLHWVSETNRVVCFICYNCFVLKLSSFSKCAKSVFVTDGFDDWKRALEKGRGFNGHEGSNAHSECVLKWSHYTSEPINSKVIKQAAEQQVKARHCLAKILKCVKLLGRQGLPFRGHDTSEGNLEQLVSLLAESDPQFTMWLAQRYSFTGHSVQNELIETFGYHISKFLANNIAERKYFSMIVDETSDVSVKEQVSICIRSVDLDMVVHEEFLGYYETSSTDGEALTNIIKDVLLRYNLNLQNIRALCFDGASNMSGKFKGVATRIAMENPLAHYIHCWNHCLNLAVQDASRVTLLIRDLLDRVSDIHNLIDESPKRHSLFQNLQLQENENPATHSAAASVKPLCPTRWTVRASAIASVKANYETVIATLEHISTDTGKAGTRASGLLCSITSFSFILSLEVGFAVFSLTDTLSKTLQTKNLSASSAHESVKFTLVCLLALRTEEQFSEYFEKSRLLAENLGFEAPFVPRIVRRPRRYETGCDAYVDETPESYYRRIYFEFIDGVHGEIQARFDQKGFATYLKMESLLLTASKQRIGDDDTSLMQLCAEYDQDLAKDDLLRELKLLPNLFQKLPSQPTFTEVCSALQRLDPSQLLFPNVRCLVRIMLTMPVSAAIAERSFSSLRRLKTYLRSTIGQARLNGLALMHVNKQILDDVISLVDIANSFTLKLETRKATFGLFSESDFK